ncbi:hypothetical protein EDD90_3870 [Streptomyces sp. Ag109_O5-1]|uniref:DUF5994 family protein n=1 Tax=Streptomyces sp. Ag109_O5-1 TaxID=1938851 RepID=UPI000F517598|nr:DUF5994 family protein [Streptomyces sp. Ag109_O5-1]RPE40803.1 hypothetical protein EDD90_3870 [Streptomyces sp. Ag109_O5-1]
MTATILLTPAVEERTPSSSPPRLVLAPAGTAPALIDGAWWPRSRDLTAELPALIEVLDPLWGRITQVTVNPTFWPVIPRRVPAHGHVVHVGWFEAEQDPHKLLLLSYTVGRWDLLVIPPETAPATAARLMATATDPARSLTATGLIHEAERFRAAAEAAADSDSFREAVWDSEGGHDARHPASRTSDRTVVGPVPTPAEGV